MVAGISKMQDFSQAFVHSFIFSLLLDAPSVTSHILCRPSGPSKDRFLVLATEKIPSLEETDVDINALGPKKQKRGTGAGKLQGRNQVFVRRRLAKIGQRWGYLVGALKDE